jgi:hypothetical protein
MATEHILALLIQERDKLNHAIEALQGHSKRMGRPRKTVEVPTVDAAPKRTMSAATRRKMAAAQKKRWAAKQAEK